MATLDDLALCLQKVHRTNRRGQAAITAQCPAHDDKNPSFWAVAGDDGWLHVNCPLCSEADILRALGWENEDRRIDGFDNPSPVPLPLVEYVYREADGSPVLRKTRYYKRDNGELKKSFFLEEYWNGGWSPGLKHLNGSRDVLYQLPEVLKHKGSRTVYIVNGEKAVDRLRKEKLLATCQAYGEGAKPEEARGKWKPIHAEYLKGATEVVIVADLDAVGEAYAKFIAAELSGSVPKVSVVQSKTGKPKDDAFDHFEAGFKVKDFIQRPDLLPSDDVEGLAPETGVDFTMAVPEYLWEPYLWFGQGCMFSADSGVGKSSLTIAFLAGVSKGCLPNDGGTCPAIDALYFIGDADDFSAYETLYRAHEGIPNKVRWVSGIRSFQQLAKDARTMIRKNPNIRFIVVDPFLNFMVASGFKDPNNGVEMVAAAGILADLAAELNVVVWIVHHDGKGGDYLGSCMIKARVRGYLQAKRHPVDKGIVVVRDRKGSILVERGEPFAYRRVRYGEYGVVEYVHSWTPTDEDEGFVPKGRPGLRRKEAKEWLLKLFGDIQILPQETIVEAGERAGFSYPTLRRAFQELEGRTSSKGYGDGKWRWILNDPYA